MFQGSSDPSVGSSGVSWRKCSIRKHIHVPANFFWDISVRVLSWECWDFWRRHDHFRRFPKKSEVFRSEVYRSLLKASSLPVLFTSKRKVLSFIHFTHGFRSLHGSELTYVWKLCQARRQQLTFFNQAWEIGPQTWAGVRSKFSTRRRETHAWGVRVGRYKNTLNSFSDIVKTLVWKVAIISP